MEEFFTVDVMIAAGSWLVRKVAIMYGVTLMLY